MPARRPTVALVVLVSVLAGATGCSFGMRTAPSDPGQRTHKAALACMADMYFPAFDTVSAGVGGYNIVISHFAREKVRIYGVEASKKTGLTLGITQAALFGLAATYGYVQLARCSELSREKGFDTTRGTMVDGRWRFARARPAPDESSASTPKSGVDPRHLAPGSEDDPPRRSAPAPERQDDRPRRPAQRKEDAVSTELPSWSAFRRYPLPPENPLRAPATRKE